jgi:hypothetical protein
MRRVMFTLVTTLLAFPDVVTVAPPQNTRQNGGPFEAPVGHLQPTVRDLAPGIAPKSEGARTRGQKAFDKQLQICRSC